MSKKVFHISLLKRLLPLVLLWAICGVYTMGQTEMISGVVNKYSRVTEMYERRSGSPVNAVKVSRPDLFNVGEVVMLYAPKGWDIDLTDGGRSYAVSHPNAAAYSINKIDSIFLADSIIVFVAPTPFSAPLKPGEMAQLIYMPNYKNARVIGTLTAQDWSQSSGEGGVVALYVEGKLTLEADIDASGKGFEGADPSADNYTGGCYQDDTDLYGQGFYPATNMHLAGLKGEGAAVSTFDLMRGRYPVFNGGGGGNARFSGGGGGSNYSQGGNGGGQSDEACVATTSTRGRGGLALSTNFYSNTLPKNRLYFGGGGGTGTQTPSELATKGGDGGGIVVIIADTIEATNAVAIRSNGESVTAIAKAGAGGGGGGGTIVLDVSHFKGHVSLEARGGDGGDTDNTYFTGPGGGGGGGIYWISLEKDTASLFFSSQSSLGGEWLNGSGSGLPGTGAERKFDLVPPLNGFLFNSLPNDRTVCTDETPDTLFASKPKGGSGSYTYQWHFKHPDSLTWDSLAVDTFQYYVFKGPLQEPMELRRIVQSDDLVEGDDVSIIYSVTPRIWGNTISAPDIICSGLIANPLEQLSDSTLRGALIGEPHKDTTYKWIKRAASAGPGDWQDVPTAFGHRFTPSGDTETTLYSRVVYSGVCDDTSNVVQITVLPTITNNTIGDTDTVCFGQQPSDLTGTLPENGDGSYTYVWQVSDDLLNWGDSLVTANNDDFNMVDWDDTRYIRRTVYSGADSACFDTSDYATITVLDQISNNRMLFDGTPVLNLDTITICQYSQLPNGGLDGTTPEGGDGTYTYFWQVRDKTNPWDDSASYGPGTKFNLDTFGDTTYIRRMVLSGADDVCRDYSDSIVVGVVWEITNNTLTATPETFCQGDELPTLTAEKALGDAGLGSLWQYKTETGDWLPAPGDNGDQNYDFPDKLPETLYFRRYVWSEPTDSVCFSYTDSVEITVQDSILNNDILLINNDPLNESTGNSISVDSICAGLDLHLLGTDASQLTGGDETNYSYTWEKSSEIDFSIVDNTGNTFDYSATDFRDAAYYRRTVVSGVCADTTYLLVHPIVLPSGKLNLATTQSDTVCASDELPVQLSIAELILDPLAAEYAVHASYLSPNYSGNDNFTLSRDTPGTMPFFVNTDSAEIYVYHLDSIVDDRGCVSELLDPNEPSIMVYFSPEATITATAEEVCGPSVGLVATNKGGVSWRWLASTVKSDLDGSDTVTINHSVLEADANLDFWFNDTVVIVYGFLLETSGTIGKVCADTAYTTVTHYQEPESLPYFIKNSEDDFGDSIAFGQVYFTDRYTLNVDHVSESGKGEWSIAEGSPGTLGSDLNAPVMDVILGDALDEDNIFVWTVSNGVCEAQADQLIVRRKDVDVYEGISPNGDGLNDVLAMRGIKYADRISLQVFNSWGTKIFSMTEADEINYVSLLPNDPDSEELRVLWDGKVNGVVVPDGTYYYTVRFTINEGTPRENTYSQKSFLILSTQNSE
jgi:hypothetical protein